MVHLCKLRAVSNKDHSCHDYPRTVAERGDGLDVGCGEWMSSPTASARQLDTRHGNPVVSSFVE